MFKKRNIKSIYLRVLRKIRNFFTSGQSKQFFIFLFFFFMASGFWLLRTLYEDYETIINIPVRLKNIPNDVVLTVEPVNSLKIKVKDKGTALLNYKVGKNFYPISVDFTSFAANNISNSVRIPSTEFQQSILNQLSASSKLLSISPDTLSYVYSHGERKKVPITLQGNIKSNPQYYITDTLLTPDSALVYAPKDILDTITAAYSEVLDITNIKDTLNYKISLLNVQGAKFIPDQTEASFLVDLYTEKTVVIPLMGVGFPEDKILRTFPAKVDVTFQLGLKQFQSINETDFSIAVPYGELLELGRNEKYGLKLSVIPDGVQNVRISPDRIDFLIEKIAIEQKEDEED